MFTVFGLNGFLKLFSTGPVPPLAGQFLGVLFQSHYVTVVWAIQIIGGLALLLNRMTPLALTVLGPVTFNILLFHITMAPAGLPPAVFVAILWLVVAYRVRGPFAGLFQDGGTRLPPSWLRERQGLRPQQGSEKLYEHENHYKPKRHIHTARNVLHLEPDRLRSDATAGATSGVRRRIGSAHRQFPKTRPLGGPTISILPTSMAPTSPTNSFAKHSFPIRTIW